jgi:hypothetical protein
MLPRDKLILAAESVIVVYVLYQVTTTVYNHLKAKDRLKRKLILIFRHPIEYSFLFLVLKLLYKDNVD